MLDLILANNTEYMAIMDIKVLRGAVANSNHCLPTAIIRMKRQIAERKSLSRKRNAHNLWRTDQGIEEIKKRKEICQEHVRREFSEDTTSATYERITERY